MGEILEISTPSQSHSQELCKGISRLLDSEDVGSDFEFSWADSTPIKAHFFVLQIFCGALQNSNCRRICFESSEIQREDVRCLLEFVYRGKTRIKVHRLDAVKRAAIKLRLETFLDLVEGKKVESVEEEVDVENETDTKNEEELGESLAEDEDNVEEDQDSNFKDRDYTECLEEEEEQKTNIRKHEKNGGIKKHLASKKYDLRSYQSGNLNAHLPTKPEMVSNGHVLEKSVKCDQCEYTCATELILKTHNKNAHCASDKDELERDHACETCGKCFQTATNLRSHKKMHVKKVYCKFCRKKFALCSIRNHQMLHEVGGGKKFKCTICAYQSRDRLALKVHLKNVHHMSEGKIARLVYSEATLISRKIRRRFKGQKKKVLKN